MCTSIYLGALSAMARMAKAVGQDSDAAFYEGLAEKCARLMDEQLFNGEYYQQKVQYLGLRDTSFAKSVEHVDDKSSELQQLLKREGPKYQYGEWMPFRRRYRCMDGEDVRHRDSACAEKRALNACRPSSRTTSRPT